MTMFISPFHFVNTRLAHRQQVRKALQMLSVSGVVRPGHVETRYLAHPTRINASYHRIEQTVAVPLDEPLIPSSLQRPMTIELVRIRHFIGALRPAGLQVNE
jgi:hypothetical protein